nr:MAG TPA: hypothetical protein [Caudoviricetes sp.]
MAKTREIICTFYECEGKCSKGRAGTFRHKCQTCNLYLPKKHCKPARKNLKKNKLERIKRENYDI